MSEETKYVYEFQFTNARFVHIIAHEYKEAISKAEKWYLKAYPNCSQLITSMKELYEVDVD